VEHEAVEAGRGLLQRHPGIDAVVLECTNLPPYRQALQMALGVEVYDVRDLLRDFWQRLASGVERG
jgi:hypothetical protein